MLTLSGIAATLSRGPAIGVLIAVAFVAAVGFRPLRVVLPIIAIALGVALAFDSDGFARWVDRGIPQGERSYVVEINGEPVLFNGTRNRLLIFKLYGPIMLRGGAFGYGTQASSGFPPRGLPGLPADPTVRSWMSVIDNSYLNVGLRFGFVGLALFAGLMIAGVLQSCTLVRGAETYLYPCGWFTVASFAGVTTGLAITMLTVYLDYDYGFWVLLLLGVQSGMMVERRRQRRGDWIDGGSLSAV